MRNTFEREAPYEEPIEEVENESIKKFELPPEKVVNVKAMTHEGNIEGEMRMLYENKAHLKEMSKRYGMHIPEMDFMVAADEKGVMRDIITADRVEGVTVAERLSKHPERSNSEMLKRLNEFFTGYFQSLIDAAHEHGAIYHDLDVDRLVYGKRKGDERDEVYLTDIEPDSFMEATRLEYAKAFEVAANETASPRIEQIMDSYPYADFMATNIKLAELRKLTEILLDNAERNNARE